MSNRWISQTGAGTLAGTSFANAAPLSDFVAQEAAVTAGEALFFYGETLTLTAVLTVTALGKKFVGINPSTGTNDGSIATIDGGNTILNCIDAFNDNYCKFENLEFIRATGDGLKCKKAFCYNVKSRNNGAIGINDAEQAMINNCHANNNSTIGFKLDYGDAFFSQAIGNGTSGYYCIFTSVVDCIAHANVTGVIGSGRVTKSVIDGNTTGINLNLGGGYIITVRNSSVTYNTTGMQTDATEDIIELDNYFYSNTAKFGGTTANIYSYGSSVDGGVNPYANRATDNFKPTATAPMLDTAIPIGMLAEATNITYGNSGLEPDPIPPAITCTDINPADGGAGTSVTITGTNFTGSGNIVKFGGSGGTSATLTAQSTTSLTATVPSIATGDYDIYIENSGGANIVVPNGYKIVSTAVPVFAGITNFEILSNNKFYVKCGTATNSPLFLNIYIGTTATPYSGTVSFKVPYSANKEILVTLASNHLSPLVGGTTYYCSVRAENSVGEDTNTAVLSNICSGAEMIQRMNIVTPVVTL